jgi:hypothetical protein
VAAWPAGHLQRCLRLMPDIMPIGGYYKIHLPADIALKNEVIISYILI